MVFFEYIRSPVTVKDDIATQDYIQHLKIPCLGAGTGQCQDMVFFKSMKSSVTVEDCVATQD
jgi:hypothetical protein